MICKFKRRVRKPKPTLRRETAASSKERRWYARRAGFTGLAGQRRGLSVLSARGRSGSADLKRPRVGLTGGPGRPFCLRRPPKHPIAVECGC